MKRKRKQHGGGCSPQRFIFKRLLEHHSYADTAAETHSASDPEIVLRNFWSEAHEGGDICILVAGFKHMS